MRSKIVATLGPASTDYDIMKAMVKKGVRIFRLNFSHSNAATFEPVVQMIRKLEKDLDIPLTAMGDLCGPKIRIGVVKESPKQIEKGELVYLGLPHDEEKAGDKVFINLDMPELLHDLKVDMPVALSDGMLQFKITRVIEKDEFFEMQALNGGILTSRKGITFPGKTMAIRAMTDKDRTDLHEGMGIGLDAVALSFVQDKDDILDLKAEIEKHDRWIPVVAKLERRNAIDNLDEILAVTDAVMVARGDLGLECPLEELPIIQKKIIRACRHAQKAAIVATQMLLSMVKNPVPTRAETTDVANAILDGADCVMLSEETAIGSYPLKAVSLINGIAKNAEIYLQDRIKGPYMPKPEKNPAKYLAYAATLLADNLDSAGLVCHSSSGATAKLMSSRRPAQTVYALTGSETVMRYLNFYYNVKPSIPDLSIKSHVERAERFIETSGKINMGDVAVITAGQPTPGQKNYLDSAVKGRTNTNQIKIYYK